MASAFVEVYINHLFDNLESGKRDQCFGKKTWKKFWILHSKNLCEYLLFYLFIPTARHVFRVSSVDAEGGHSHTLQAPNEEEKKQWLNAIRSVIPSPENYKTYLWCHAIISQVTLHLGIPPWQLRKLCRTHWTSKVVMCLFQRLLSCESKGLVIHGAWF